MIDHGLTRYTDYGCRCDTCRHAGSMQRLRWGVAAARNGGSLLVDGTETRRQLVDLARHFNQHEIGRRTGTSQGTVWGVIHRARKVTPKTAAAVQALWNDHCAPVEPDRRRYPAEPLIRAVEARYGSVSALGEGPRRSLQRLRHTGLSAAKADQWALKLVGKLPSEIWDTYGQPETEEAV